MALAIIFYGVVSALFSLWWIEKFLTFRGVKRRAAQDQRAHALSSHGLLEISAGENALLFKERRLLYLSPTISPALYTTAWAGPHVWVPSGLSEEYQVLWPGWNNPNMSGTDSRIEEYESKAFDLLRSWLSSEQLYHFDNHEFFIVVGHKTRHWYRIVKGRNYNVRDLSLGRGMCFQPIGCDTVGDTMLAQKLLLETDEDAAFTVANYSNHFPGMYG